MLVSVIYYDTVIKMYKHLDASSSSLLAVCNSMCFMATDIADIVTQGPLWQCSCRGAIVVHIFTSCCAEHLHSTQIHADASPLYDICKDIKLLLS